mmetsp:Transcript_122913/g.244483  ORF Transcript_122913/g.244483 Transcript_122913/m.244483 type:complete len:215 (-) Transcript_122913:18-662(-)
MTRSRLVSVASVFPSRLGRRRPGISPDSRGRQGKESRTPAWRRSLKTSSEKMSRTTSKWSTLQFVKPVRAFSVSLPIAEVSAPTLTSHCALIKARNISLSLRNAATWIGQQRSPSYKHCSLASAPAAKSWGKWSSNRKRVATKSGVKKAPSHSMLVLIPLGLLSSNSWPKYEKLRSFRTASNATFQGLRAIIASNESTSQTAWPHARTLGCAVN